MLTKADKVWNRAALESGRENPLPGDVALADLLQAHGMITNGLVRTRILVFERPRALFVDEIPEFELL